MRQSTGYDESFPISFHHAFRLRRELKEEIFEFMPSGHIDCDREDAGLIYDNLYTMLILLN